jgi:hypothetical protein
MPSSSPVKRPEPTQILAAITNLGGDGYVPVGDLFYELRADRRLISRALRSAIGQGLVLERRAVDGRRHVAVASEGWRLLREAP